MSWTTRKEVRSAIIGKCYAQVRRMAVPGMSRRVYFWAVVSKQGTVKKQGSVAKKKAGDRRTYYQIAMEEAEKCALSLSGKRKNPSSGFYSQGNIEHRKDLSNALKEMKKNRKIRAKNRGDFQSAMVSAAYYAMKHNEAMYVYGGNSYMTKVYRVSSDPFKYLSRIDNTDGFVIKVTPSLAVTYIELIRKNPAFSATYWTPSERMKAARAARAAIEKTAKGGIRPSARKNAGFARVRRIMMGQVPSIKTVGILTAENPQAKQLSAKQNRVRNQRLVRGLREMGYGPIPLKGMYGIKETSYLVPNMTRKDTTGAGKAFDQESVIWASRRGEGKDAYMVWQFIMGDKTTETRDVSLSGRDIQTRKDFFSEKKGRKFAIPFFDAKYSAKRYYRKALDQKKRQLAARKPSWRKNPVWERHRDEWDYLTYVAHGYLHIEKDDEPHRSSTPWVAWVAESRGNRLYKVPIGEYRTLKQAKAGAIKFHKSRSRKNPTSNGGVIQGPWKSKWRQEGSCAECGERPPHKGKDPRGRQAKLCKPCEDMFVEREEWKKREARNRKAKIRRSKIKLVPKPRKNPTRASYKPMLKVVGERSNPGLTMSEIKLAIKAEKAAVKKIEQKMKKR